MSDSQPTRPSTRLSTKPSTRPWAPFLVFEGLDGSGKSTLIQSLAAEINLKNLEFVITREPGGTPMAEEIRNLLLRTDHESPEPATELLLYAASRAQHVACVIQPALSRGDWVLCDRFSPSTVAFQSFARGLARKDIDWLNAFAEQGTEPDLVILLDLSIEESRRRQSGRAAADRMEKEKAAFHEAVRQGYLAQAKERPQSWLVLDARETPEALKAKVVAELERRGWLV
jgi:dTMP kinase